jgi:hypothetical protein
MPFAICTRLYAPAQGVIRFCAQNPALNGIGTRFQRSHHSAGGVRRGAGRSMKTLGSGGKTRNYVAQRRSLYCWDTEARRDHSAARKGTSLFEAGFR